MNKGLTMILAVLLSVLLIFTGAFAQGNGQGNGGQQMGDGQQTGGNQPPDGEQPQSGDRSLGGGQMQNQGDMQFSQNGQGEPMNINVDAIRNAIDQLDDEDTKAALSALLEAYQTAAAGDSFEEQQAALQELRDALNAAGLQVLSFEPMNNSYNFGREYGRFLDVEKAAEAIAAVTDEQIAADLAALLSAYADALNGDDPQAVKTALEALMEGLAQAQLQVDEYTGLQLTKALQGAMLDTAAVEAAIAALEDPDTAAALTELLDAYIMSSSGGNMQAAQEALTGLMDALTDAGIQV